MIREILEQGRVNIKDLSIPEPERAGRPFNPENDLDYHTWDKITARTEEARKHLAMDWHVMEGASIPLFYKLATTLKIISPSRLNQSFIDDELRENMKSGAQVAHASAGGADWEEIIERSFQYKTLFPDNFKDLYPFPIDWEEDYIKMVGFVKRRQEKHDSFWLATMLGVISDKDLASRKYIRQQMMPAAKERMETQKVGAGWWSFIQAGAFLRVLFPQEFSKIKIDDFEWEEMKNLLKRELAKGKTGVLLPLSILGAGAVMVEKGTLRLVNYDITPNKVQPTLPQVRRF